MYLVHMPLERALSSNFLMANMQLSIAAQKEILSPPPGTKNVGEWCKKDPCWEKIRQLPVSSDDKLRAFQDAIFMQDKPILESQSPKCLPLDLRAELHTTADKASSLYRRHLKNLEITFGVC